MVLVYCDAGLVERVFINLLENALKYAGEQATIAITAHTIPQTDTQENALEIIVQDNGPGIEPGQESMILINFLVVTKSHRFPAWGWGWRSVEPL